MVSISLLEKSRLFVNLNGRHLRCDGIVRELKIFFKKINAGSNVWERKNKLMQPLWKSLWKVLKT